MKIKSNKNNKSQQKKNYRIVEIEMFILFQLFLVYIQFNSKSRNFLNLREKNIRIVFLDKICKHE
jgi:hypothetical protein